MSMNKHLFLLHSVHWSHDLSSSFSIYHSFNYSCLPFNSVTKKTFIHSFPLVNWTVPLAFSITLTFIPRPLSAAPPQQDVSDPQETDPSSPPCPTSFSQPPSPLPCPTPFTQPPCANSYLTHSVPCPTPDVNVQVFRTILVRQYKHWGIWKTVITFTL